MDPRCIAGERQPCPRLPCVAPGGRTGRWPPPRILQTRLGEVDRLAHQLWEGHVLPEPPVGCPQGPERNGRWRTGVQREAGHGGGPWGFSKFWLNTLPDALPPAAEVARLYGIPMQHLEHRYTKKLFLVFLRFTLNWASPVLLQPEGSEEGEGSSPAGFH